MTCQHCERRKATTERDGEHVCDVCFDTLNDRAHQRLVAQFYGGATPDPSERAWQQREGWRR